MRASRFLRDNLLSLVAIFLVLNAGAYAVTTGGEATTAKRLGNSDLATASVDTRTLASGAITGPKIHSAAVGPKKIKLDKLQKYLQARVNGQCPQGQVVRAILADGSVECSADQAGVGTISGIATSGGLTGGGTAGDVAIGVDPAVLQSRVDGCSGSDAIGSVAQDGTVTCESAGTGTATSVGTGFGLTGGPITGSGSIAADPAVLQSRIAACGAGRAIQTVNQDGTVSCGTVDFTDHSGYIQLNDNPSQSAILVNFGGALISATCLPGGNAQVEIRANGGAGQSLDYEAQSSSVALNGDTLNNTQTATIANTATNDLGRFNVTTSTGRQVDGTYFAWAIATTGGVDCVFDASALTF